MPKRALFWQQGQSETGVLDPNKIFRNFLRTISLTKPPPSSSYYPPLRPGGAKGPGSSEASRGKARAGAGTITSNQWLYWRTTFLTLSLAVAGGLPRHRPASPAQRRFPRPAQAELREPFRLRRRCVLPIPSSLVISHPSGLFFITKMFGTTVFLHSLCVIAGGGGVCGLVQAPILVFSEGPSNCLWPKQSQTASLFPELSGSGGHFIQVISNSSPPRC